MKKTKLLAAAAVFLMITGCQKAEEKAEQNMTMALKNIFETVSEAEYDSFMQPVSANGNEQVETQEIPDWLEERFDSCVSGKCFEQISGNGLLMIPVSAYESGKTLTLDKLTFEPKRGYYEFQGTVIIEGEGKSQKTDISGSMQMDREGKVSSLKLSEAGEILDKIKEKL